MSCVLFVFCSTGVNRQSGDCLWDLPPLPPPPLRLQGLLFVVWRSAYLPGDESERGQDRRYTQSRGEGTREVGPPCSVHTHNLSSLCGRQTNPKYFHLLCPVLLTKTVRKRAEISTRGDLLVQKSSSFKICSYINTSYWLKNNRRNVSVDISL